MSVYFLTGCAGFIASNVAEMLLEAGHSVYGIDDRNNAYSVLLKDWRLKQLSRFENFHFQEVDITDRIALENFFQEALTRECLAHFDACIHLAARAGVRYSVENPWIYLDTNVTGTLNLLESMQAHSVKNIVFSSSQMRLC